MKLARYLTIHLAVFGILLAGCGASFCATVTLDAATRTATSDTATLEPSKVRSSGEQIGVYVQSTSLQPQRVTIKIPGLKEGSYDVYVNWGEFRIKRTKELSELNKHEMDTSIIEPGYVIRDKSAADLAAGIEFEIPGRVVPASLLRCVTSVQSPVKSLYDGLGTSKTGEPGRARYTLGQAADWARSAISTEETYRSVQLFAIPAGVTPKEMDWRSKLTTQGTNEALANACSLLHKARVNMYNVLTDALLREATVASLTPLETHFRYSLENKIPTVTVRVTNNCDLNMNGAVDVKTPKGWSMKPKQLGFMGLKSGDTVTRTLQLIPASKGQSPPADLLATVTIKVTDAATFAKLRIERRLTIEGAK